MHACLKAAAFITRPAAGWRTWLGQGPMEFGEHKPESCSGAPPSLRAREDATLQFLKQVRILEQWSAMFYDYHQI